MCGHNGTRWPVSNPDAGLAVNLGERRGVDLDEVE
jgi:hypothetical protein